jgi:phi LC3 family holin
MNIKVRLKNKTFWLSIIPAILLVGQIVGSWFGYEVPADKISNEAVNFINAVFVVLTLLGIVSDPTTKGVKDSKQAMTYTKPK